MKVQRSSNQRSTNDKKGVGDKLRNAVFRIARVQNYFVNQATDYEEKNALRSIAGLPSSILEGGRRSRVEAFNLFQNKNPENAYFTILRIDRFEQLGRSEEFTSADADELVLQIVESITECMRSASVRRINRRRIEFVFSAADFAQASALLSSLQEKLDQLTGSLTCYRSLQFSIGAALAEGDAELVNTIDCAERALALAYSALSRFVIWDEDHRTKALARLALASDLRRALVRRDLDVVYQPKLNLKTGRVDSAEALVRWIHSTKGPIPADEFVKLAEDGGDIAALTRYVLRQTLADQATLREKGIIISMNVNLSGGLISDEGFCDWALRECGHSDCSVSLEITETAVIIDPERAFANLHRLVEGGVGIAIDDYGSGLSSLVYLKQLPARELKIDKLFILGLTSSHRDPLIVRSTIDLAHALEMEVTAEGVENQASLSLLRAMGCDRAQGYFIAKPLSMIAFMDFVATSNNRSFDTPPQLLRANAS